MSSFFNRLPPLPEKPISKHPWDSRIKPENSRSMKYAHNSITSNLKYPKDPKQTESKADGKRKHLNKKDTNKAKDVFTVIGIKFCKEFIYCRHWVKKLYMYRKKRFGEPMITGVTTVEWPKVWNDLKLQYSQAYCINSPVVILLNGEFLGGHEQLKEHLEKLFNFNFILDYHKESLNEFSKLLNSTSRPFVYMHFSVDDKPLGTMIFMLYSDIVPITCENFMRLCRETQGGYAGTPVHRIVKDCWIQCGGFGLKSTDMTCENFVLDFDKRGVLGMANADRHVDCSTQFFVISQPAQWMKHHYVAFGQLIDGEGTFKAIEDSPTWYESPTQDIKIYKAGIINLECDYPITVNKNTREYVYGHTENLNDIGEYFWELVMSNVSKAIFLDYLKNLESTAPEGNEEEDVGDEAKVRPVKRFVHNKSYTTIDGEENNDFDVDSYQYEPEESNYDHVSVTSIPTTIKPDIPYYIALTDVPYPDEVDSNFDMKRFLRGKYCLESDVNEKVPKIYMQFGPREDSYSLDSSQTPSSEESSLDSESKKELENHLRKGGEGVCIAGTTIKKIARSLTPANILQYFYSNKTMALSDEELRAARLLAAELRISKQRLSVGHIVKLTVSEAYTGRKIKRRPTGYLREADVVAMIKARVAAGIEIPDSDESDISLTSSAEKIKRTKGIRQPVENTSGSKYRLQVHESTLHRLYSDYAMYEGEKPTLKDYRAVTTLERDIKTPSLFLTMSERVQMSEDSIDISKTIKQEKNYLSTNKRMMEATAVEKQVDQSPQRSIRSYQFAKTRPSLTVKQYQDKNKQAIDGNNPAEVKFMPEIHGNMLLEYIEYFVRFSRFLHEIK